MLAEMAAGIGEAVWKVRRLRQKKQARVVVNERRQNDEVRFDRVVGAVGAVIGNARDAAGIVAVDAVDHGSGQKLEISRGIGLRQRGDENGRLRAGVAAEGLTEAAIG